MSEESIVVEVAKSESDQVDPAAQTVEPAAAVQEEAPKTITLELDPDSIPEKFRKDPSQIFKSYAEAETELGRTRSEIGTWRSLVEDLASTKRSADLAETQATEQPIVTSDSLLEDPVAAISQVVAAELEKRLAPLEAGVRESAQAREFTDFKGDYPDFEANIKAPEFVAFVQKSPYRQADAKAASGGNVAAARRLMSDFTEYKELSATAEPEPETTSSSPAAPTGVAGARKVATEKSGSSGAVTGKKIYTSHEVVQTILRDPDLYRSEAYQADLMAAMNEGRYRK